jgi:recombination protein RecR
VVPLRRLSLLHSAGSIEGNQARTTAEELRRQPQRKAAIPQPCHQLLCDLCRQEERRNGQICVVADSRDLLAMERTREYHGAYHVLGGLISPMDGVGPELLKIQPLVRRVDQEKIQEVILALTPSVEGDTTSLYLARLLKPFTSVSRIAYGLPMGGELEYADQVTLARALEGRRPVE